MNQRTIYRTFVSILTAAMFASALLSAANGAENFDKIAKDQVPTWSQDDMDFFLHGSMSTEVLPESVLRAFMRTYPDLYPSADLSHLGMLPDAKFGWPIGISRKEVPHLGGLSAIGLNCAACHVGEVVSAPGATPVRVLGMTSHFDAEAFFGAAIVSTFRTQDPANMKKFLASYLEVEDPVEGNRMHDFFEKKWLEQETKIAAAMKDDPSGSKGLPPGALNPLPEHSLDFNHRDLASADLAEKSHSMLKLFHNMRAALHVPDEIPANAPPASGPGRNDAFGLLSAALFRTPQPYAPVKYGLVWNVEHRSWVHWDGNTRSPLGRNLLASLGLGAPLIGKHGELDYALVKRQTDISEKIRAPHYPYAIDSDASKRGAGLYQANCAGCHNGEETDKRLYTPAETGTQPLRAMAFNSSQAQHFNEFFAGLETPGYTPPTQPPIRSTQKYFAASLNGVWARSPYLHNGSVRTMKELLSPAAERAKTFHRGSRVYDTTQMGYIDEGSYVLDTIVAANGNKGHEYGASLSADQKRDLIEYLKTF